MDITPIFSRKAWNQLTHDAAARLLQHLVATRLPGFTILRFEQFDKFGQSTYTAVMAYEGCEFVFVPGDTITLGLDPLVIPDTTRQQLAELMGGNMDETNTYLQERLSPLRTATIAPMIVERQVRETGYFPVALNDERLLADNYFEKTMAEVSAATRDHWTYTVNDSFRLVKNGDHIQAFLYEPASYPALLQEVSASGFSLPTEDEWEYLCGGGSRSLYPWGNSVDQLEKYHHYAAGKDDAEPYILDIPNHFGLVIANNPYRYEVTSSEWFLKSGDGGCNICGGAGMEFGYLPVSSYYRDSDIFDEEMNYKGEITGDYTFTRRIKHLDITL